MSTSNHIVIIGTGIAGLSAAQGAREVDPGVRITLIGEDCYPPYDRTHLSKQMLKPEARLEASSLMESEWFDRNDIQLVLNTRIEHIDTAAQSLLTSVGETIQYDALVLALGTRARQLPASLGQIESTRIHTLRSVEDALRLQGALDDSKRLVIVGAGLIGLEVAAAARARGITVDVIEASSRILQRSCDPYTAERIASLHTENGVKLHLGQSIESVSESAEGSVSLLMADGTALEADLMVVGIGVIPNTDLAESAGVTVDNGVVVDGFGRTNVLNVYAAGDIANLPLPGRHGLTRLETWRHAQDHGRCVGMNAAGQENEYKAHASFWSDQYEHRIQGVGLIDDEITLTLVRQYEGGAHVSFLLDQNRVLKAVLGIDAAKDVNAMGKMVGQVLSVSDRELEDEHQPLVPFVKKLLKKVS